MRLVVFDLDGTLVDTVGLIVETVTDAFEAVREPPPAESAIRALSGIGAREAVGVFAPKATPARLEEILESYRSLYRERSGVAREPLFRGARDALDRLQQRPDTILAVATGKGYHAAVALLERHALIDRFLSVETPDHNRGKPDPHMIETAMDKAGATKTQTVMIGDTVHDMKMAKAAGVAAVGVSWGYHTVFDLNAAGADMVIEDFAALDRAIDELLGGPDA